MEIHWILYINLYLLCTVLKKNNSHIIFNITGHESSIYKGKSNTFFQRCFMSLYTHYCDALLFEHLPRDLGMLPVLVCVEKLAACCPLFVGTVSRDFWPKGFFMDHPQRVPWLSFDYHFDFFLICFDIQNSRVTAGVDNPSSDFTTGILDTRGKFTANLVDTSRLIFSEINIDCHDTVGNFAASVTGIGD